jgi:hypothetical protein
MRKPNKWVFVNLSYRVINLYGEIIEEAVRSIEVAVNPFCYGIARNKAISKLKGILKREQGSDAKIEIGLATFNESPREQQLSLFPSP